MFNAPQEIVWLLNLMNINDSRVLINVSDVFDKDGELLIDPVGGEVGKEILERKCADIFHMLKVKMYLLSQIQYTHRKWLPIFH